VLPDFDNEIGIGIVGTRQATAYGLSTAKAMGSEIAACGGLVISGMAAGIDAMATQGALDLGRPAVGVLGCGVDVIYPTSNRKLYQTLDQQGCLLSEFPPGEKPNRWNFPKRNRIISGLSCGVLVVEAPVKSGALITARQAIEQGRDVFVVPGNIGIAACEGSNALMKDGAAVATCGWDVLEGYDHIWPGKLKKTTAKAMVSDKISVDNAPKPPYIDPEISEDLDETEQRLLQCLSGRMLMDALIAEAALDPGEALAALTLLEVKGLVCTLPGGWVEKA
jgi:DNA processing protein